MDSNRYDIQAKAERNSSVKQVEGQMLQALLEERPPDPVECSEMISGLIHRKGLSPELASWAFST